MDVSKQISDKLISVLNTEFGVNLKSIKLDTPPKKELGDFCFGAFFVSKPLGKKPQDLTEEIKSTLEADSFFKDVVIAGPFINFKTSQNVVWEEFKNLYNNRREFISPNVWKGETVVVDFIGANVWKPLHIGHMCTPNQGQALINLYKKLGYNVIWDSHLWDWGIIFGKLITAYKLWGEEAKLEKDPVNYLLELYIKITAEAENDDTLEQRTRDEFKLLSEGDKEATDYWAKFTKASIDGLNKTLGRLYIKPDYNIWESFYEGLGLPKMEDYPDLEKDMATLVEDLIKAGVATRNEDNSAWVVFPETSKLPSVVLQKRDGTHGYLASDVATIYYRMQNWKPKKIIYCIDVRQQLHLKQAFEICRLWGFYDEKETTIFHAHNGFISLKDGAMSTRKGKIILLDSLLDEAKERAKKIILEKRDDIHGEELEKLAETIGVCAIKYGYLSKHRQTDVVFDWDEFMSFEGNSGPYIAYSLVRANKLLNDNSDLDLEKDTDYSYSEDAEVALIKEISNYQKALLDATKENTPHTIAGYAYALTKKFSTFYNDVKINADNEDVKVARLKLVSMYALVLKEAMDTLAITLPEKM